MSSGCDYNLGNYNKNEVEDGRQSEDDTLDVSNNDNNDKPESENDSESESDKEPMIDYICNNCHVTNNVWNDNDVICHQEDYYDEYVIDENDVRYYRFADASQYLLEAGEETEFFFPDEVVVEEEKVDILIVHRGRILLCNNCESSLGWICTAIDQREHHNNGIKVHNYLIMGTSIRRRESTDGGESYEDKGQIPPDD